MPPSALDGGTGGTGPAGVRGAQQHIATGLAHATGLTPEHLTTTHRRKTPLMLNEHTLDQLRSLRLDGMVRAI